MDTATAECTRADIQDGFQDDLRAERGATGLGFVNSYRSGGVTFATYKTDHLKDEDPKALMIVIGSKPGKHSGPAQSN